MNIAVLVGSVVLLAHVGGSALAQSTLGELVAAGAKKLPKQDLVSALSDAKVTGPTLNGGRISMQYKADGTFSGNGTGPQGGAWGIFGTWAVDAEGTLCGEYQITSALQKNKSCGAFYVKDDKYYYATGATSDSAVLKRTIVK
jgi:hypothetical protein